MLVSVGRGVSIIISSKILDSHEFSYFIGSPLGWAATSFLPSVLVLSISSLHRTSSRWSNSTMTVA